jgi:uncharacterized membrane protein YkvA (DUF1232 family)
MMLRKWFLTKVAYSLFKSEAQRYTDNKEDASGLLKRAFGKAKKNEVSLKGVWGRLQTMFELVKAWASGSYREIPYRTLLMIMVTIVYFVSPIDFIPDFLFGIGILDDAALIAFVISQLDKDLEAFSEWRSAQKNIVEVIVNNPEKTQK